MKEEDSEKNDSSGKVEENSAVSKTSEDEVEEKSNTSKSRDDFLKKLDTMFPTRKSGKKDKKMENLETPKESEKKDKETKESEDQTPEQDPHAFPMMGDFLSSDKLKDLKSGNNKLVMGIGIFIGVLLIGSGIFLIVEFMGSPGKIVADNAEFGDIASFSVFLILAGILLIAGVFARKFLDKSFLKGLIKNLIHTMERLPIPLKKNIKRDNLNRINR